MAGVQKAMTRKKPARPEGDATPDWLSALGLKQGEWQNIPKPQLRSVAANPSNPDHVRVWALGMMHSYGYRRDRAMILHRGAERPMRPHDLARMLGLSRQNVRRALARLEAEGLARRLLADGTPLDWLPEAERSALGRRPVQLQFVPTPRPAAVPPVTRASVSPTPEERPPAVLRKLGITVPPGTRFPTHLRKALDELHQQLTLEIHAVKWRYVERLAKAHYVKYDQNTNVVIFDYLRQSNMTTSTRPKHMQTKGLPGTEMKIEKKREIERPVDGPRPLDRGLGESPSGSEVEHFFLQAGRPRPLSEHACLPDDQRPKIHEIADLVNGLLAARLGATLDPDNESARRILAEVRDNLRDTPLDYLAQRIMLRSEHIRSFGILPHLARECAGAANPATLPAGASPAEIQWIAKEKAKDDTTT